MSDDFAELLKQMLCESADVTKLVDCVWSDNRCRTLLIRKIQSTPEAITPEVPVSKPYVLLDAATPEVAVPHSLDLSLATDLRSHTHNDDLAAPTNSPLSICSDEAIPVDPYLNDAALPNRSQTPDKNTSPAYPSPSLTPGPQPRNHNSDVEDISAPYNPPSRKRRRSNKNNREITEASSAKASQSPSSGPPRRFRGPGKKKKGLVPYFEDSRFLNVKEPLRLQVAEYTELKGIQDALKLVEAFEFQTVEVVQSSPSDPLVRKLKCRLDECDNLERKGYSLAVRAQIERNFNVVQVIAEFYRRKSAKADGETDDDIVREFKKELFPEQTPKKAQAAWDYFYRVGRVLLEVVQRYGYGVLVFPLYGVTKKSLHELGITYIGNFLDFLERCQPGLEAKIRNLSYILPRLMTLGLPTGGLQIDTSELDHPDGFNRCFSLPAGVDAAELQLPYLSADISSWPEEATTGCVVSTSSENGYTEQDGFTSQQCWNVSPEEDGLCSVGCEHEVSEAYDILGF